MLNKTVNLVWGGVPYSLFSSFSSPFISFPCQFKRVARPQFSRRRSRYLAVSGQTKASLSSAPPTSPEDMRSEDYLAPLMMQPALIFRQSAKLPPPCWRTPPACGPLVPIGSDGHGRSSWISLAVAPSGYLACAGGFDCCSRPGAFPQSEMAV